MFFCSSWQIFFLEVLYKFFRYNYSKVTPSPPHPPRAIINGYRLKEHLKKIHKLLLVCRKAVELINNLDSLYY